MVRHTPWIESPMDLLNGPIVNHFHPTIQQIDPVRQPCGPFLRIHSNAGGNP